MKTILTHLIVAAGAVSGLACQRPPLALGSGQLNDGRLLTVAAATFGDDDLQLMAADGCSELVAFRNFPSWQWDSCANCTGKPIGGGILSASSPHCGSAAGSDWTSAGECGAALTVDKSTVDELSGTLRIDKSTGGSFTLEFRAARLALREEPGVSKLGTLCDASAADRLATGVCCDWYRNYRCGIELFEASCRL